MADPRPQHFLEEFVRDQSPELHRWWEKLRGLNPQLVREIGQVPVFGDAEYRRRGRDPIRPTYDICDVQDSRDEEPGVWIRVAGHKARLAEFVVARYYDIHQPLQPGLAILLTRAVDAGDRQLARLVQTVAAASQDLEIAEQMVGMELGTAYAIAGHRPCWAAPLKRGVGTFAVADPERFERQEPYLFLVRLVDGLLADHAGWRGIADLTLRTKAA